MKDLLVREEDEVGASVRELVQQQTRPQQTRFAVRFGQLLSAPFLAALETQIFVNNPRN